MYFVKHGVRKDNRTTKTHACTQLSSFSFVFFRRFIATAEPRTTVKKKKKKNEVKKKRVNPWHGRENETISSCRNSKLQAKVTFYSLFFWGGGWRICTWHFHHSGTLEAPATSSTLEALPLEIFLSVSGRYLVLAQKLRIIIIVRLNFHPRIFPPFCFFLCLYDCHVCWVYYSTYRTYMLLFPERSTNKMPPENMRNTTKTVTKLGSGPAGLPVP